MSLYKTKPFLLHIYYNVCLLVFLNLFFLKNSCPDAVSYVHIGMCSCCSSCQIFVSLWSIRPSWLHEMILPSLVSFPRPPFLREAFGNRSGCVPCPSPMRHAPRTFTLPMIIPNPPPQPFIPASIHRNSVLIHSKSPSTSKKFPRSFASTTKVRTFALAFRKGSPSDKRMDL